MRLVPMRFKGVEWRHNPREISFECEKKINELKSPNGSSYIQNMGRKNMVIKGEGELYGEDCLLQFDRLLELYRQGKSGVLAVYQLEPVFAVFEGLKMLGEPKPNVISYSFVFREVMEEKVGYTPSSYIAQADENLWDISYRFNISIDTLVRLNPQCKRPDISLEGEEVILC